VLDTMDRTVCQDTEHKKDELAPDLMNHGIMDKMKDMWD